MREVQVENEIPTLVVVVERLDRIIELLERLAGVKHPKPQSEAEAQGG